MMTRTLVKNCVAIALGLTAVLLVAAAATASEQPAPMDWPHWRGPEKNGISREKNIVDRWSPQGENLLWKREELAGRSTPIVMNGKLYTLVRDQPGTSLEAEKVVCIDAATGDTLWENRFNVYLSDVPDTRVGWSSVVGDPATGHVFALGVCGYFQCIDGNTGETLWDHSLSEEYGLLSTYGGRTNFPVVYEDLVMISAVIIGWGDMAKPTHRYIAFDKRNGQPVWFEGTRVLPEDTTYSSPIISVIDGQPQLIFASGDGGVHAFQPRTGQRIWSYNVSARGINTTPVVVGNTVLCGHSEENLDSNKMGALFAIDATQSGDITASGEKWRVLEWFVGKSSPVCVDGRVYAAEDTGTLIVADVETGQLIAEERLRGPVRASPLYVDGKLFVCTENGIWWTFRPSAAGVETVHRARLNIGEVNASPIVSHGRMYVSTSSALYCIGDESMEPSVDPLPQPPSETPIADDQEPAHLQVVPVESLLQPGQRQQFQVRLFNANGQLLRIAEPDEVAFQSEGPGSIDEHGKYSTPTETDRHSAVIVSAEIGGLKGSARIRVVPDLPWSFDFSSGEVPITWVGARYRHIPLDFGLLTNLGSRDQRARQLYIYLTTDFVNTGQPAPKYDDSTPRQTWSGLLRYLELFDDADVRLTLDGARAALDPALEILKEENIVESWSWSEWPRNDEATGQSIGGPELTVHRGTREIDPEHAVIAKITTIPKGTRSHAWMGHIGFHDYTMQADVLGAEALGDLPESGESVGKLPDIGITGQRYALDLKGAYQELQIRTWHPQLRMARSIPFPWQGNVWYTMKLSASVQDGEAVLRGKVWRRGETEPAEWQLEARDASPNLIGSPGLYGDAKNGEIFYDNIQVTEN